MKTEVILSALEAKHPGEKEYLQAEKKEVVFFISGEGKGVEKRYYFLLKMYIISTRNSRKRKSSSAWLNQSVSLRSVCPGLMIREKSK